MQLQRQGVGGLLETVVASIVSERCEQRHARRQRIGVTGWTQDDDVVETGEVHRFGNATQHIVPRQLFDRVTCTQRVPCD
jgi:hypothetical protein